MKIKDGFILREVAGENIVIPASDTLDFNAMITLNETGKFLWEHLTVDTDENALVEALTSEYEVSREDAVAHIKAFIAKLNEHGFIE